MGLVIMAATTCLTAAAEGVFGLPVALEKSGPRAMALALEGTRLYAGCGGRIVVYDVSEPLKPRHLGETDGLGAVRQLVVQDGFVYATARESGLWIVDATDPAKPRIRSRFDTCELATGVDVAGGVCFCGQRQNGVEFIDVSDPDRPAHIAIRKTDESQSVIYRDGTLYSGDWWTGHVTVFDARDMRAIRQVAYPELWGNGDGLWQKGRYLYAATGHHARNRDLKTLTQPDYQCAELKQERRRRGAGCGHGLDIFDVSNPTNPVRVGRADYPPFYARGNDMWTVRTSAASDLVFAAQTHNGLFAVDCADPAKPRVVDRWTHPNAAHPEWPSDCVGSVAVGNGCVYVAGLGFGVVAIPARGAAQERVDRGRPPLHPEVRETYPTDTSVFDVWHPERAGQARAIALKGDVVYAACGDAGLHVLRILPSGGFAKIGELKGPRGVFDVQVEGDRLFTAEGLDGWAIYALDGATGFREVARRRWLDARHDPALIVAKPCPGWIVLSTRRGGVHVFADEAFAAGGPRISADGGPGWDKFVMDAPVCGNRWLGFNMAQSYLSWLDLSAKGPAAVHRSQRKNCITLANGMCRWDDKRAFVTKKDGYFFLEGGVTDPAEGAWPVKTFPGQAFSGIPRRSAGGRIVLTCRTKRLVGLWDFKNPDAPVPLGTWSVTGNPDTAVFYGERFIVPCGHQGVIMYRER